MSTGTIVIVVIGIIVVAIIAYFVMSHLKGSLDINLPNTSFSHGETIQGSFTLNAKKPIEGNELSVALIAHENIEKRDSEGKKVTQSREVYKSIKHIDGSKEYPAGHNETYQFEFTVPCSEQNDFANSTLGQAAKLIGSFLDNEHKYIEWKIEANLDAKGIDIGDSQKIYIDIALST